MPNEQLRIIPNLRLRPISPHGPMLLALVFHAHQDRPVYLFSAIQLWVAPLTSIRYLSNSAMVSRAEETRMRAESSSLSPEDGRRLNFVERWVALVQRRPWATITLSLALALVSVVYTVFRLDFKTKRIDLVSPREAYYQDIKRYEAEFGAENDILVVVTGADRGAMTKAVDAIAKEIGSRPDVFTKLCYKLDISRLREKGLFQLSLEDLKRIDQRIDSLRPLLVGAWSLMTVDNFLLTAQFKLRGVTAQAPMSPQTKEVFDSAAQLLESTATFVVGSRVYRSPWNSMFAEQPASHIQEIPEYFFSESGRMAFLRVMPAEKSDSFLGHTQAITLIREMIAKVKPTFPQVTIGLTGVPVLENDEMISSQSSSAVAMVLSNGVVLLLVIFAFRAVRHPLMAMCSLAIAYCWTMGWVTLTVGHLNVLSVTFLVTLTGLGIDYGILWLSRYESYRQQGLSQHDSNSATAEAVGGGIAVGGVANALSFLATVLTGFLGLQEMGWILGSGVLLCLVATLTLLPALLAIAGSPKIRKPRLDRDALPAFPWLERGAGWVAAGVAILALALGSQAPKIRFDYNLLRLQSDGLASVEWEKRLLAESGTSGWYALTLADTPDQARKLRQAFETKPAVGRVVEIASLIPQDQDKKAPLIREVRRALARIPDQAPTLPTPNMQSLAQRLADLAQAKDQVHPNDRPTLERLGKAAAQLNAALVSLPTSDQSRRLADFEKIWLSDLLDMLRQLRGVSNADPVTVADLPPALAERYIGRNGKWLVQIFSKSSVWDIEPLREFCGQISSVDPTVTGKPVLTLHALTQMTDGYRQSAMIAGVVIFLTVWLDLRRFVETLLAMVPLVLGLASTFGVMVLCDIPVNPANMLAFPLVLGVGVDFGVHILHDFHHSTGAYTLRWRFARALIMTSVMTIVGFASLLTAQHRGTVSIGLVLSIGVFAIEMCALFLLPALLRMPWMVNHVLGQRPESPKAVELDSLDEESSVLPLTRKPSGQIHLTARRAA